MHEFEIRNYDKTFFIGGYDRSEKVRRERGQYYARFDSKDPLDVRQWRRLFESDSIALDGHSAKDLAAFEPGFAEAGCKRIYEDLKQTQKSLPGLIEEFDSRNAEAAVLQVTLDENTDVSRTDALFAELRRKQDAAALAKAKLETQRRRIKELEVQLRESLSAQRKIQADKFKSELAPLVEDFNRQIAAAFALSPKIRELLPKIAEFEREFAPDVYFLSPVVPTESARKLKTLQCFPRVTLQANRLLFSLKEVE